MSTEIKLTAESRTEFGKGAARRLRRDHRIPAVVYAHGNDPLHIALPGHDTMLALKHRNAVVAITVDGDSHLAYAKMIQRDPVKDAIEHVDFVAIRRGERIQVDIPVTTTGSGQADAVITVEHPTITITGEALHLPEGVEVDVNGFAVGRAVLARELDLPSGVELVTDPKAVVVQAIQAQRSTEPGEEETAGEGLLEV